MSGLDELKNLVQQCNDTIYQRQTSEDNEIAFGPTVAAQQDNYVSQEQLEHVLAISFKEYAEIFNTIREGAYNEAGVHSEISGLAALLAADIKGQANLEPLLERADAVQQGQLSRINHETRISTSFAATKFFDRCLHDFEQSISAYAAFSIDEGR